MNGHVDAIALAGKVLIDRIIQNLSNAMVQCPFIGASDVHPRLLPDRIETLQFTELGRSILAGGIRGTAYFFCRFKYVFLRHKNPSAEPLWPSGYEMKIVGKIGSKDNSYFTRQCTKKHN